MPHYPRIGCFSVFAFPVAFACGSAKSTFPTRLGTDNSAMGAALPDGRNVCSGTGPNGFNPYKYPYFGDLHSHTSFSLDAYSFGTRGDPRKAYLFAKGQGAVDVGSGSDEVVGPTISQARPIDFLAVTDHSEWLSVTHGCTIDRSTPYHDSSDCGLVRSSNGADEGTVFERLRTIKNSICDADSGATCGVQARSAWQELQSAAAAANSPCRFTSLVAYEWTGVQEIVNGATNVEAAATNHRNVIFAGDRVPAAPLDSYDYPNPRDLWTGLDSQCTAASGCEAITIPHNTNLSAGVSLVVWDPTPAGIARQRKYQISAEIYQHKAGSECFYDPHAGYSDTDCQFEYTTDVNKALNLGPASFVRESLGTGLGYAAENPSQGNPFKLGIVGGTDDHNGAPGDVDEAKYVGHLGRFDDIPLGRLRNGPENGSGALTGAWAEENTRAAIFAAIKRRETFATSGPRIQVRLYQTTDATACSDPAFPKKIIDAHTGVPMGSTFGKTDLAGKAAPTFVLTVWPDAVAQGLADGTQGVAGIAKVQIIKLHARAGAGHPGIVEDPPNVVSGISATGGCATWTDPSFDASEYSVYYVRTLQVPTWRWSHYSCATLKKNNPTNWQTLVPGCVAGGGLDVSIQERAWTSPIWFEP